MPGTAGDGQFVVTVVPAMTFNIGASTTPHEATLNPELQIRTNALNFSLATARHHR